MVNVCWCFLTEGYKRDTAVNQSNLMTELSTFALFVCMHAQGSLAFNVAQWLPHHRYVDKHKNLCVQTSTQLQHIHGARRQHKQAKET